MIPADHVAVGSRVRAKDVDTGTVRTLTFLGPWDVDVAAGIYSYRAPLSLSFMGRAVGDVVTVPVDRSEQTLEIVEIASGLA